MNNSNLKTYGIILLAIAGFTIFRNYFYFYWEWMYQFGSVINWSIAIACAVIGIHLYRSAGDVK